MTLYCTCLTMSAWIGQLNMDSTTTILCTGCWKPVGGLGDMLEQLTKAVDEQGNPSIDQHFAELLDYLEKRETDDDDHA
jgi:hypothetical protein